MSGAAQVVVIAGPNGAGKSTAAPELLRDTLAIEEFVNADAIAVGLSGFDPDRAAIAAGRVMLARLRELAERRVSFAFETTLASRTFAPWLRQLRAEGWRIEIVFLWLPDAELAVARVGQRVLLGGHHVPDETVRRRHGRGLRNFLTLYRPLAHGWTLYDSSGLPPRRLVACYDEDGGESIPDASSWRRILGTTGEPDHVSESRDVRPSAEALRAALDRAIRRALLVHKKMGNPVAVWRDGKVVWIPPEEIPVDEEPGET